MQLIVQENSQGLSVRFYLKRKIGDYTVIVGQRDGILIDQPITDIKEDDEPVALLELPKSIAESFIKAISDYSSRPKVRSKDLSICQGNLFTTELTHYEKNRDYFQEKNKFYYQLHKPYPVKLSDMKVIYQQRAFENGSSIHAEVIKSCRKDTSTTTADVSGLPDKY